MYVFLQAFIKRLLQVCGHMQPTFICGSLILVSEILKLKPNIIAVQQPREPTSQVARQPNQVAWQQQGQGDLDDDDEEEHFMDVKLDSENEGEVATPPNHESEVEKVLSEKGQGTMSSSSWVHRKNKGNNNL